MDPISPRPETPVPNLFPSDFRMLDLRTPSFVFNHGGLYAPADPRDCNTPIGPCDYCQERISAAEALVAISKAPSCCVDRPSVAEPCPECRALTYITHASKGLRTCNGCDEKFCTKCYYGSRYCCSYVYGKLPAPTTPPVRQEALGVQSPKAQEKGENK